MIDNERCATCKFWLKKNFSRFDEGLCRRYPKQFNISRYFDDIITTAESTDINEIFDAVIEISQSSDTQQWYLFTHPTTNDSDYCGEWIEAKTDTTTPDTPHTDQDHRHP